MNNNEVSEANEQSEAKLTESQKEVDTYRYRMDDFVDE